MLHWIDSNQAVGATFPLATKGLSGMAEKRKHRIPRDVKKRLIEELGNMRDTKLAAKYSEILGFPLSRQAIFFLRQKYDIPPFHKKIKGRLEEFYPEVLDLLGKVPIKEISKRFGVTNSSVRETMKRFGFIKSFPTEDAEYLRLVANVLGSDVTTVRQWRSQNRKRLQKWENKSRV